jgi:hypothetical protein
MEPQTIDYRQWSDRISALGFKKYRDRYRKDRISIRLEPSWMTLNYTPASGTPASGATCGRAGDWGLWKSIHPVEGVATSEFHIPLVSLGGPTESDESTGEPIDKLAAILDWAWATARGRRCCDWIGPPRNELERLLPTGGLTVQSGPFVRQGELLCQDGRLTISFPIVHAVPTDLSGPRSAWLKSLLGDLQNGCRMVRMAEHECATGQIGVVAQVDLSGVPQCVLERLFRMSVDAARHVAARFAGVFELLADPAVKATTWEVAPRQMWQKKERNDDC